MSAENVEVVRRSWEHFASTGEVRVDLFTPDCVLDFSAFRGWPEKPSYEGLDGISEFLRDWSEPFEEWHTEIEGYHDAGDEVVTVCRQHARARNSGVIVEMRFATVSTVSAGLQTRTEFYADPHEALQAVGLE